MSNIFYTPFLMGGIGNQMFQISNVLSRGWENNIPSIFRPNSFNPMQGNNTKKYVDNIFRKLIFKDDIYPEIRLSESNWGYTKMNPPTNKSIEFYGYFQSSKNFYGYENEIKETFSPTEEFLLYAESQYPEIKKDDTLSIHIRRGDCFLNLDIHPVVTIDYINKCLDQIKDISHTFIFTDDKLWVKENIKLKNVTFVEESDDYKEIWLMSLCKNNIIVNSTFSWWGSYLNKNPNKIVIAPSIWFGPRGPKNYKDIYENNWTVIDVIYNNGFLQ